MEKEKVQIAARQKNVEGAYKCRVPLSSFPWMDQLHNPNSISEAMLMTELNYDRKEAFDWPFTGAAGFNIVVNQAILDEKDAESIHILWEWFESQRSGSYFSFVFRKLKLGIEGSVSDDLALLMEGPKMLLV